jgi:hypothetical protein
VFKEGGSAVVNFLVLLCIVGFLFFKWYSEEKRAQEAIQDAEIDRKIAEQREDQALGEDLARRCHDAISRAIAPAKVLDVDYKYRVGVGRSAYPGFARTATGFRVYQLVDVGGTKHPTACYLDKQRNVISLNDTSIE